MISSLKLLIDIDCDSYTNENIDPKTKFFEGLNSMDGVKYKILPLNEINTKSEEDIFERGLTNILTAEIFHEVLGTPNDNTEEIINVFKKFLDRIINTDHLILVDSYIFSDKNEKNKYSDFVYKIFSDFLKKLQKITFITSKLKYNNETEKVIFENFKNKNTSLILETKFSNLFHDRFWLCGKKGLFVGSSLNGIGKKYCLIDYIDHDDILDINKHLVANNLI